MNFPSKTAQQGQLTATRWRTETHDIDILVLEVPAKALKELPLYQVNLLENTMGLLEILFKESENEEVSVTSSPVGSGPLLGSSEEPDPRPDFSDDPS